MIKKHSFILLVLLGLVVGARAQNASSSYSIFGIGNLTNYALAYNNSMGGLGISNGKPWILNNINPALLPLNNFTTFDAGIYLEKRTLHTSDLKESNVTGGLNYLTFGFPIMSGKWTMAIGLMPYSNVSYDIVTDAPVVNNEAATGNYKYVGSGGVNQVYLSSGWSLVPQRLNIGVRVGYAFGTVKDQTIINLRERVYANEEDTIGIAKEFETTQFLRESRYSDFLFEGGLNYRQKLNEEMEMNLGFVYELGNNFNMRRDERISVVDRLSASTPADTILSNAKGVTFLPQKFGGGISISKEYKWTFGIDYYSRDWTQFKSDFGRDQDFQKSYEIIVGGEFTPDFFSVTSYLKRIAYQFGFDYEQTPVKIKNASIDDFGINIGVSLPVGPASIINLGFRYGQMGTTSDELVREDYFKISLGVIFNDRSYGFYRNQRKLK